MKEFKTYHILVQRLRHFFLEREFVEIPVQSNLSILAACEDPRTVTPFVFNGQSWPLPQTGQMHLERVLLENQDLKGVYCISTSYRNEPQPIEGRHDLIFPMFEFESFGDVDDLIKLEKDLLTHLCILGNDQLFYTLLYNGVANRYGVIELEPEHEELMCKDYAPVVFLTEFPETSHPFWNMKRNDDGTARKVDVIINGMETIGSAEREIDSVIMRDRFHSISDGEYAGLLYSKFGKERVGKELDDFLSLPMVPRFGGGIGLTRLAKVIV